MIKRKFAIIIMLLIILNVTLTGCWNYREINNLSLATGIAIDKNLDTSDSKYTLTTEIFVPKQRGVITAEQSKLIEAKGETIFKALRNSIKSNGKMLYWGHCKIMLVSEQIAKEGLIQVLDLVDRNPEIRPDINVMIAEGEGAGKTLQLSKERDDIIAFKFKDVMDNQEKSPSYRAVNVWKMTEELLGEGIEPTAPIVRVMHKDGNNEFKIGGLAVFKKDKMVGKLTENETEVFLYMINEAKNGVIVLNKKINVVPVDLSLEVLKSNCKITPLNESGKVSMLIDLQMDVALTEIEGSEDVIEVNRRKEVEKAIASNMKRKITNVIGKVQGEYSSDIFGFGKIIMKNMPSTWKSIRGDWEEEFKTMSTEVNVKVNITKTQLTSQPLKAGE